MKKISLLTLVSVLIAVSLVLTGCIKQAPIGKQETDQSTKIADETADWQVYKNEEYGFQIKYPPDWEFNINKIGAELQEVMKLFGAFSDKTHKIIAEFGEITALASIDVSKGTMEEYGKAHNAPIEGTSEKVTINNYPAVKEKRGFGDEIGYMIDHPEGKYRITLTDHVDMFTDVMSDEEKEEVKNIINKIFSTFEFVD